MANVQVIPATINFHTHMPSMAMARRRTAGYARVSTDADEQFTSYEAQVDYYTRYINSHADWEFVKVYTDEGISGTDTKHRDGFNEMITDALDGKIDLIVTKSVSRFARNTVDSLTTIRKLKEKGVEVYFEKENIWTFDSKGELLLTIMSSLAQEESRSISENVTWGKRKSASDGKVYVAYSRFLGYDKGEHKCEMVINPEQAELVKRIYRDFMSGKTAFTIATELTEEGIPTPGGKTQWRPSTVNSILSNEKYKGCARLQKTYTVDFLSKTQKKNEGEVPQYMVTDSHEAIIQPDEWELVQKELLRRKHLGRRYSGGSVFSSKIICGDCGGFYGPKVWQSNTKYRKTIWQCSDKYKKGKEKCSAPYFSEDEIKAKFVEAFNLLFTGKDEIIENCELIKRRFSDTAAVDAELTEIENEIEVVTELTRKCIEENAHQAQNQEEYQRQYDAYTERFESLRKRHSELICERTLLLARADSFRLFIGILKKQPGAISEFDDRLWQTTIKQVIIQSDGLFKFVFQNESIIIV